MEALCQNVCRYRTYLSRSRIMARVQQQQLPQSIDISTGAKQAAMSITLDEIVDRESRYGEAEKLAMLHRRVSIVGYNPLLIKFKKRNRKSSRRVMNIKDLGGKVPVCSCCGRFPRNFLSLNFDVVEIGFLGQGYSLYFTFQKLCLIMLVLFYLLVITSKPVYQWTLKHADKKIVKSLVQQTDLLCLNVALVCTLSVFLFAKYMVNLAVQVDEIDTSPQDYSVLVKNIPLVISERPVNIEDELVAYFEKSYKIHMKVEESCLYYNLVPLNCIETHKTKAIDMFKAITPIRKVPYESIVNFLFPGKEAPKMVTQYHGVIPNTQARVQAKFTTKNPEDFCKEKINMLTRRIDEGYANNELLFIGQAVLSFENQDMAEYLLSEQPKKQAYFYGNQLQLEKPEHPKGIYWYNLHLDKSDYKVRSTFSMISCSAIFLCSLFLQVLLNYLKLASGNTTSAKIFGFTSSVMINLINLIIPSFILRFFSSFEGHRTRTDELMSFVRKSLILQVMNTLAVPLVVTELFGSTTQSFLDNSNGVMFRNAFFSVIQLALSAKYLWKELLIMAHRQGYQLRHVFPKHLTVRQLCELYEYPPFEIEARASDILKTMLVTFFLGYEVKKVVLYAIISFYFNYWIDKYNLSRKRTVRYHVNSTLNSYMMKTVQLAISLFVCSQLLLHNRSTLKIMVLAASLMLYLRPFMDSVRSTRKKDEVGKNYTYQQCKQAIFETDYRRQNPALRGKEQLGFAKHKMTEEKKPEVKKSGSFHARSSQ